MRAQRADLERDKFRQTKEGTVVATLSQNSLVKTTFNSIEITSSNANGDPTAISWLLDGDPVASAVITYDSSGNFQRIDVTHLVS